MPRKTERKKLPSAARKTMKPVSRRKKPKTPKRYKEGYIARIRKKAETDTEETETEGEELEKE